MFLVLHYNSCERYALLLGEPICLLIVPKFGGLGGEGGGGLLPYRLIRSCRVIAAHQWMRA